MKKVYLITRNKGKLDAARHAFAEHGIKVLQIKKDYPEIQSDKNIDVARYAAKMAAKEHDAPVIREDHGFYINALSGFPGPYGNYFERTISSENILEMMKGAKDRRAYFVLAAALAFPDGKVKEFVHEVHVEISDKVQGGKGNWDDIIMLPGAKKTFSQTPDDEWTLYWTKNFEEIARYLEGKKIWR